MSTRVCRCANQPQRLPRESVKHAVLAVTAEGHSVLELACRWGVSRQTVHGWLRRYEERSLCIRGLVLAVTQEGAGGDVGSTLPAGTRYRCLGGSRSTPHSVGNRPCAGAETPSVNLSIERGPGAPEWTSNGDPRGAVSESAAGRNRLPGPVDELAAAFSTMAAFHARTVRTVRPVASLRVVSGRSTTQVLRSWPRIRSLSSRGSGQQQIEYQDRAGQQSSQETMRADQNCRPSAAALQIARYVFAPSVADRGGCSRTATRPATSCPPGGCCCSRRGTCCRHQPPRLHATRCGGN